MFASLRANGSRECAPDDRLREATQRLRKQELDCFVAEFIIGPAKGRTRWLLAMTVCHTYHRHPEEPRILRGVSKDGRRRCGPSFEARREERRAPQDDDVIARSVARKQSSLAAWLWIASRSLSSGAHSRDPLARNDAKRSIMLSSCPGSTRASTSCLP